jgi:hypothetical protein
MRNYNLLLFLLVFVACNTPALEEDNQDEKGFELQSVPIAIYDSLRLAPGINAEILDSLSWPSTLIAYQGGLIIGQNPHRLTGDLKPTAAHNNPTIRYYNVAEDAQIKAALPGFQTAMCEAPWGGILMATTGKNKFDKGYIYHFFEGVLTRLDALGSSCFTGVAAHQTQNGKAIIYYSDFTSANSNLYKFVSDSGTNCYKGTVYAAKLPTFGWMNMDRDVQPLLANKYKSNTALLENVNEATRVAGYVSNYAIAAMVFDKYDGSIKYSNMPLIHKEYLFGSLDYIFEDGGLYDGTSFHNKSYILAGSKDHYSHAKLLTIDDKKGLWISTGMSVDEFSNEVYQTNGGNALLIIPQTGVQSNLTLRLAVAPKKGRFSGLVLDKKQHCVYTTLQDQQGKAVLLKLTGPSVVKLLD